MSRDAILAQLRAYPDQVVEPRPASQEGDLATRLDRFQANLGNARARVIRCVEGELVEQIGRVLDEFQVKRLCYGLESVVRPWVAELPDSVEGVCYSSSIESFRKALFSDIDAGLTACEAALAETGTLVLASSVKRPRLLSLVPPLHIVVVRAEQVFDSMADWLGGMDAAQMPSNFILVSGPSKSADIEQVLAYGVHGPRALVVLLVDPD
jgi:L-lactate dehydrogenase complex protein LldG